MAFGRRNNVAPAAVAATTATATDYGAPTVRSNRLRRPLLAATHALHIISSVIVLGISAYFIKNFTHNAHLRYWIGLAAVDTFLYLPVLVLPAIKTYKGYLAPMIWLASYLWLVAVVLTVRDYNYEGGCAMNSPSLVNKCNLKHTLEAFAFLAFFTSLVGALLEARLWDIQRFKRPAAAVEKHHGVGAAPAADVRVAHQAV